MITLMETNQRSILFVVFQALDAVEYEPIQVLEANFSLSLTENKTFPSTFRSPELYLAVPSRRA